MLSKYNTNFYIRKDSDKLYWAGLSIDIPNREYSSYKLSSFIKCSDSGTWTAEQVDLMIFDKNNNMYRINNYQLSQLYNPHAQDKNIIYKASLSRPEDRYSNMEISELCLNEMLIKNLIDEFKIKSEQSFGFTISI